MRGLVTILVSVALIAAPAVQAQPAGPAPADQLAPAIETCIRDNAASVEKAIPDLNQAVEFLAAKVCAVPVEAERQRLAKALADRQAEKMKAACARQQKAQKDVTPPSPDEDNFDVCSDNGVDFEGFSALYVTGYINNAPPAATALASKLLLDLRLSNSKSRQTH
jgi:hypothetical protein